MSGHGFEGFSNAVSSLNMQSFSKALKVQKARKVPEFRVFKDLMAQGVRAYIFRIRMRHAQLT